MKETFSSIADVLFTLCDIKETFSFSVSFTLCDIKATFNSLADVFLTLCDIKETFSSLADVLFTLWQILLYEIAHFPFIKYNNIIFIKSNL